MSQQGQIRVGISGWRFDGWRGTFYPEDLLQKRELEFASRKLNSIELNGTFYSTQKPQSFQSWRKDTPDDFVFSIKGSQFITHIRKLENVEGALANFLAQGMLCLGKKLGPILWQLPPQTSFNAEKIEAFLKLLPHTHRQAATYAKQRDEWMAGRCWLGAGLGPEVGQGGGQAPVGPERPRLHRADGHAEVRRDLRQRPPLQAGQPHDLPLVGGQLVNGAPHLVDRPRPVERRAVDHAVDLVVLPPDGRRPAGLAVLVDADPPGDGVQPR